MKRIINNVKEKLSSIRFELLAIIALSFGLVLNYKINLQLTRLIDPDFSGIFVALYAVGSVLGSIGMGLFIDHQAPWFKNKAGLMGRSWSKTLGTFASLILAIDILASSPSYDGTLAGYWTIVIVNGLAFLPAFIGLAVAPWASSLYANTKVEQDIEDAFTNYHQDDDRPHTEGFGNKPFLLDEKIFPPTDQA